MILLLILVLCVIPAFADSVIIEAEQMSGNWPKRCLRRQRRKRHGVCRQRIRHSPKASSSKAANTKSTFAP